MSKIGWISVHRKLQDHWLWKEKRTFSKAEAWIDILFLASHSDTEFLLGNEVMKIKKGSFITSELKLMERWSWSKSKVRAFLELLKQEKMLDKISDNKKTTLTVLNYRDYQNSETTKEPQKDFKKTSKEHQKDTINNYNNINNENNDDDEEVKPTPAPDDSFKNDPNQKISISKWKETYLKDEILLEAVLSNPKNKFLGIEDLKTKLAAFVTLCLETSKAMDSYQEYCKYFRSWAKYQDPALKPAEDKNNINKSYQQLMDEEQEYMKKYGIS